MSYLTKNMGNFKSWMIFLRTSLNLEFWSASIRLLNTTSPFSIIFSSYIIEPIWTPKICKFCFCWFWSSKITVFSKFFKTFWSWILNFFLVLQMIWVNMIPERCCKAPLMFGKRTVVHKWLMTFEIREWQFWLLWMTRFYSVILL